MNKLGRVIVNKAFTHVGIFFAMACLLLALIPTSALALEIQPTQSSAMSQINGLGDISGTGSGINGHIGTIYYSDIRFDERWRMLEGKEFPSAIGTLDVAVVWYNDSDVDITGHIYATVHKPDGNSLPLEATRGQDVTLVSGEAQVVNFDVPTDQSGPWVLGLELTDLSTSLELNTMSVNFIVLGMSFAFKGNPLACDTPPCSVTFTNLVTGGALPYQNAIWDFGDETEVQGEAVHFGETVTHNYTDPGSFDVTLEILDAENVSTSRTEVHYITIDTVDEGYGEYTWNFLSFGYFPRHLPDDYFGQLVLDDLDPEDIPWQVQGIYHESGAYWAPPPAPAGDYPLVELVGGLYADYMVSVAGESEWVIPLP